MPNRPSHHVLLWNDDETPMEFVVLLLERFFDMDHDEACTLMLRVHHEGKAICGSFTREDAEKKVSDVLAFAAEHKHPLKCTCEQVD